MLFDLFIKSTMWPVTNSILNLKTKKSVPTTQIGEAYKNSFVKEIN